MKQYVYLDKKKVLFISPRFFGYEQRIIVELVRQGAVVDFFDERGAPSAFQKILIRRMKLFARPYIRSYYRRELSVRQENFYDYIFFNSPEAATPWVLRKLKLSFPQARFILYMWDSVKNKNAKSILKYFDKMSSFDRADCSKFGMFFRPLFFVAPSENLVSPRNGLHDYCFIGTIHTDRYFILSRLREQIGRQNQSVFLYMYFPSRILFFLQKLLNSSLRRVTKDQFYFSPLQFSSVEEEIRNSRCIIDIHHPKQTGLTIRIFEALVAGKKIVTTNTDITNYTFYDPKSIAIVDRKTPEIPENFLEADYKFPSPEILGEYSIEKWIQDIFHHEQSEIVSRPQ